MKLILKFYRAAMMETVIGVLLMGTLCLEHKITPGTVDMVIGFVRF